MLDNSSVGFEPQNFMEKVKKNENKKKLSPRKTWISDWLPKFEENHSCKCKLCFKNFLFLEIEIKQNVCSDWFS